MKVSTRQIAVALQLVAEAQELLARAELRLPRAALPAMLRELADKIDRQDEKPADPSA